MISHLPRSVRIVKRGGLTGNVIADAVLALLASQPAEFASMMTRRAGVRASTRTICANSVALSIS